YLRRRSPAPLHRRHEPAPGLPTSREGSPVVHRPLRVDDQHDRTTGPVHGLQPREALVDLLWRPHAFDEDPGIIGAVNHRSGQVREDLPARTGHRPARIELENGKPLDWVGRDENQRRYGAVEVEGVLTTNVKRHPASIP